jgi:hypothetical protein
MKTMDIIIEKPVRGSEDGVTVKLFMPSPVPIAIEKSLAEAFIKIGSARAFKEEVGPANKKVVAPKERKNAK